MTDSGPYIDPRALEVLHDVAHDPNSTLLRTKRPRAFAAQLGSAPAELARAVAGSTRAEKELLRVYREETAYLLRLAYLERIHRPRQEMLRGLLLVPERDRERELGDEELERRVTQLGAWSQRHGEPLLELAVGALGHPQTSMMDLATLSLKFAPSAAASSYVVNEHLLADEGASAIVACERGLAGSMTQGWRSVLISKLASAHVIAGNDALACELQQDDALEGEPDVISALNWALYSFIACEENSAKESILFLNSNFEECDERFMNWLALSRQQAGRTPCTLGQESRKIAKSLMVIASEPGVEFLRFILEAPTND